MTEGVKQNIIDLFNETDTLTYKDGAKKLGISKSTLHDYATKDMDYQQRTSLKYFEKLAAKSVPNTEVSGTRTGA